MNLSQFQIFNIDPQLKSVDALNQRNTFERHLSLLQKSNCL
ncbi:MAG: hypothetical protein OFPII_38530 [Osedax symbiont Rs1]|nr:MAG: hypothetical protein OFPII_38530 [Osedax symbiont Rs1]